VKPLRDTLHWIIIAPLKIQPNIHPCVTYNIVDVMFYLIIINTNYSISVYYKVQD